MVHLALASKVESGVVNHMFQMIAAAMEASPARSS
jgi:hypothetical protein